MTCKQKLLTNTTNSIYSYFGAALVGIILHWVFYFIITNQIIIAVGIYLSYIIFLIISNYLCEQESCIICKFNEFWWVLESLIIKKLNN